MALSPTISVTGGGTFSGTTTNLGSYSATEDATPIRADSNNGGTGQVNFSIIEAVRTSKDTVATTDLISATVKLSDGSNGETTAIVETLSTDNGITAVTANSRLSKLLSTRTAVPMFATTETIVRYYLSLGGVTDGIVYEGAGYAGAQAVQGWTGVIWDNLRAFLTVVGAEIALVSNNVVVRPLRQRVSVNRRDSSVSTSQGKGDVAQSVVVKYYNNQYKTDLVYPDGGWNEDVQVYQVDAGEIFTTNVDVNVSPVSVVQPECVEYVARDVKDQSVYSVVGADGLAIKPQQWLENGGSVTVAIGQDNQSLDITIVGAQTTQGPFRIAVGAGASDVYSSLRLIGTGTFFHESEIKIYTGLTAEDTPQEVGATVENRFVDSIDRAWNVGLTVAQGYSGFSATISKDSGGINRLDTSGDRSYPTFAQFNEGFVAKGGEAPSWIDQTFANFQTTWNGKKFSDFNKFYSDLVKSNYSNQAFGNVAGSRVLHQDAYYRIESATVQENGISFSGSADTTFGDFNRRWSAQSYTGEMGLEYGPKRVSTKPKTTFTYADFNAMMDGRTFRNFNYAPLWRVES